MRLACPRVSQVPFSPASVIGRSYAKLRKSGHTASPGKRGLRSEWERTLARSEASRSLSIERHEKHDRAACVDVRRGSRGARACQRPPRVPVHGYMLRRVVKADFWIRVI